MRDFLDEYDRLTSTIGSRSLIESYIERSIDRPTQAITLYRLSCDRLGHDH